VQRAISIPLLHITDVTGQAVASAGCRRPLLLATRYTMEQEFYRGRLKSHGIDALIRIIENKNGVADSRIFNIGNPANDMSIRELAETLIGLIKTYPKYAPLADAVKLVTVQSKEYYGEGYQDILTRVPSVKNAEQYLGWKPTTDLKTALRKTLDYHLGRPSSELSE